jgi:hypothetical protein
MEHIQVVNICAGLAQLIPCQKPHREMDRFLMVAPRWIEVKRDPECGRLIIIVEHNC